MISSNQIKTALLSDQVADLLCPRCGADNLHHTGVTVYGRSEDAATCVRTVVQNGTAEMSTTDGADNPSRRRDGLSIHFWCEQCGDDVPILLTVAQHKGATEIGWRYPE